MKSSIFKFALVLCLFASFSSITSCALIMHGSKAKIGLIHLPPDLQIKDAQTGEQLKIETLQIDASKSGSTVTAYVAPGVRVKARRGLTLAFTSGNITKTATFKHKNNIGFLAFETLLTLGIGTVVDVVTGANKEIKPKYFDVSTLF